MVPRWFHLLLWLYPPAFRREYAADMRRAYVEARAGRPAGHVAFAFAILRDFVLTVPRAWLTHAPWRVQRVAGRLPEESHPMSTLLTETRYAFRRLARRPGLALVAVIALALGIGLTTAMFSIVNGVILVGLPFAEPHEIVTLSRISGESMSRLVGRVHDYEDIVERQSTFETLGAANIVAMNVSPPGERAEFVSGAQLTASTFDLLGVAPVMGRPFTEADEQIGGEPIVIVGHDFWQDRLGGDVDIVGSRLRVNGADARVVGVMAEGFEFPATQQMWEPLRLDPSASPRGQGPGIQMLGRLADGVSIGQAQSDLDRIMEQLGREHPETNAGMRMYAGPYATEIIGPQLAPFLFTMLGAVSFVLLIACANVANLLLARASLRTREVAISAALGAARRRIFGQLLLEAGIVSVLGGVLGVGIAMVATGRFNAAIQGLPQGLPFWFAIGIDPTVLGFVAAVTLAASLLSGVMPAFQASGADVHEILKDSGRGGTSLRMGRLSRGLVVAEVALSCALLVAAGLMIRSVTRLATVDLRFHDEDQLTAVVSLPPADYPDEGSWRRFWAELEPRLEALPGAVAAGVGTDMPVVGFNNGRIAIAGREYAADRDYPSTRVAAVSPGYFRALDIPTLQGRALEPSDTVDGQPVAVVNQSFAGLHFPDRSPLGERVAIRGTSEIGNSVRRDDVFYTVVGVVPDLYLDAGVFVLPPDAIYVPLDQRPSSAASIVVHVPGDTLALTMAVRDAVASIDPDLPLSGANAFAQTIADSQSILRIFSAIFALFGVVALFLATIGLYGVLAFSVSQRLHEVGIRIALGASPGSVRRLVLRQGMRQLAVGLVIGLVIAATLSRLLSAVLFDISATDPLVFGTIVVALVGTGVLACLIPARRATRVDPLEAMRGE